MAKNGSELVGDVTFGKLNEPTCPSTVSGDKGCDDIIFLILNKARRTLTVHHLISRPLNTKGQDASSALWASMRFYKRPFAVVSFRGN